MNKIIFILKFLCLLMGILLLSFWINEYGHLKPSIEHFNPTFFIGLSNLTVYLLLNEN